MRFDLTLIMKKINWTLVIISIVLLIVLFFIFSKDSNSYENGLQNPKISSQDLALLDAKLLYDEKKLESENFTSECLGVVRGYAVDVVNSPRDSQDDLPDNQCQEFLNGEVDKFIELDREGNLVRIVD